MVQLQAATTASIPTIRELAHGIWWAHYPEIITAEQIEFMLAWMYSVEMLEQQISRQEQAYWLVQDTGTAVGFISVSRPAAGQYFLHKFYLEMSEQRKGRGSAAFLALLQQYPDVEEMRLTVNRQNYKSINFYFKLGFCIEKCVDIPIGQGYVMDDFQMLWVQK